MNKKLVEKIVAVVVGLCVFGMITSLASLINDVAHIQKIYDFSKYVPDYVKYVFTAELIIIPLIAATLAVSAVAVVHRNGVALKWTACAAWGITVLILIVLTTFPNVDIKFNSYLPELQATVIAFRQSVITLIFMSTVLLSAFIVALVKSYRKSKPAPEAPESESAESVEP